MTQKFKKFVAIATLMSSIMMVAAPSPADALTADELAEEIATLTEQLAVLTARLGELEGEEEEEEEAVAVTIEGCDITSFDQNLKQGMSGDDVKCLQIVLNSDPDTVLGDEGAGSPGEETSYFGPITKAAVILFQEKYTEDVLAFYGLTVGTGFVGTTTRAKLDELLVGIVDEAAEEEDETVCSGITDAVECVTADCSWSAVTDTCSGADVEEEEEEEAEEDVDAPTEGIDVSLDSATPAAAYTPMGVQNQAWTKIIFTAGADGDKTISSITVTKSGLSDTNDVANVRLYEGSTQIGGTLAFSTTTSVATFAGLNWTIPAGTAKTLTITLSLAADGIATPGNQVIAGINSAAAIVASDTILGTFPINGNAMTIAGVAVGILDVDSLLSSATQDVLSGATDQQFGGWNFDSTNEGFTVNQITFTEVGTSVDSDVLNLKLEYLGEQVGEIVESLVNGRATFDLSATPFSIPLSGSKNLYLYGDVAADVTSARSIIFEITTYTDVVAFGTATGGSVTVTVDDNATFTNQASLTSNITQGGLTLALDAAYNPSDASVVIGANDVTFKSIKFSAGSLEGIRVTKLVLSLEGSGEDPVDIANVRLYDQATGAQLGTATSFVGAQATFTADPILDIPASQNKTVLVKVDIPSSASFTNMRIYMTDVTAGNSTTQITLEGLTSGSVISAGVGISGLATGTAPLYTSAANGTLVVALASDTPAADYIAKGETEKTFIKFTLTAASEPALISSLTVRAYETSDTSDTADTGELINVKLFNGSEQIGNTVSNPTSGVASFSPNLTIPKDSVVTLTVVADVSINATTSGVYHIDVPGAGTVEDDVLATGVSSQVNYQTAPNTTGSATGRAMTILAPSLSIAASPNPPTQSVVTGVTDLHVGTIYLTAGNSENVKVTYIKVAADTAANFETNAVATASFESIKLYDGVDQVGVTKSAFLDGSPDYVIFDNLNLTVPKAQSKAIDIKLTLKSAATGTWYFGVDVSTASQIYFTGLVSGTSASSDAGTDASSTAVVVVGSPVFTVAADATTPNADIAMAGTTGFEFGSFKMTALYDDITLKQFTIYDVNTSGDDEVYKLYLYDGATLISAAFPGASTSNYAVFSFADVVVPKGGEKVFTLKGDMNTILAGADSGAALKYQVLNSANHIIAYATDGKRVTVAGTFADSTRTFVANTDTADVTLAVSSSTGLSAGDVIQNYTDAAKEEMIVVSVIDSTNIAVIRGVNGTTATVLETSDAIYYYSPSAVGGAAANQQVVRKSRPTIAYDSTGLSTSFVSGTGQTIYRFKVTADSTAEVGLKKLTFHVAGRIGNKVLGIESTALSDEANINLGLVTDDAAGTDGDVVLNNVTLYNVTDGVAVDAASNHPYYINNIAGTANNAIVFVFSSEQVIAADAEKIYELKADISGVTTAGDYLSVYIPAEPTATASVITNKLADQNSDGSDSKVFYGILGETMDVDIATAASDAYGTSSYIIWSDRSAVAHSDTAPDNVSSNATSASAAGNSTADWTNGFLMLRVNTDAYTKTRTVS